MANLLQNKVFLAIISMLMGIVLVDFYSVIIKSLGNQYSTPQLAFFRNFFALLPVVFLLFVTKDLSNILKDISKKFLFLCFLRGLSFVFMQIFFYIAVINMNFATAITLTFSSPIFIVVLSILLLKEKIGVFRWSAIFIGFSGVLIIMSPSSEVFSIYSILPLLAALCWAISNIVLKFIPDNVSSVKINFYSLNFSYLTCIIILFFTNDVSSVQSSIHWLLMILIGILGGIASILFSYAYRVISPSTLAPFEYLGIPSSFILGWLFFNETPIEQLFPGVIGIVLAGFIIIWREKKLSIQPNDTKKLL
jgi:drug/metabolite transporter (DMT)-like permease